MPARSRHCNRERICIEMSLERKLWEGAEEQWSGARRTALSAITVWPASDGEGDFECIPYVQILAMPGFFIDGMQSSLFWSSRKIFDERFFSMVSAPWRKHCSYISFIMAARQPGFRAGGAARKQSFYNNCRCSAFYRYMEDIRCGDESGCFFCGEW